jgi:hypothetical protein
VTFVRNGIDYLNVNTVTRVRPIPAGTGGTAGARFLDQAKADGVVPIHENAIGDLEAATAPVIPTGPVTLAVFISCNDIGRPATVRVEYAPIVGWRIGRDDTASPVFAFKPSGSSMLLPVENERLVGPDGRLYRNIEEAKVAVLDQARRAYEAEHAEAVKTEPEPEPEIVGVPLKLAAGGRRGTR